VTREAVDLIILNLGMPILDGWEVARHIPMLPSPARDIPIIAFTAYVLLSSEQRARAAGGIVNLFTLIQSLAPGRAVLSSFFSQAARAAVVSSCQICNRFLSS
jgi:CheY-like chemotaxis protein